MMQLSAQQLVDIAGLTSDGIAGFEAQVATGRYTRQVLWPEHLQGIRYERFAHGSKVAREWLRCRKMHATIRRSMRAKDFRELGHTTLLRPEGAELRDEQIACLRDAVRIAGQAPN